jgi:hypothetical protein
MVKKVIGYVLIVLGFLCFLLVGGGSMRYRNSNVLTGISITEGIITVFIIILIPIIGFLLIKLGLKIIVSKKE